MKNEKLSTANSVIFSDIGKKIMKLAKIVFWVGIIGSVILGIIAEIGCWFSAEAIAIPVVGIGGAVISFINSLLLYAFGQLVDDVHKE